MKRVILALELAVLITFPLASFLYACNHNWFSKNYTHVSGVLSKSMYDKRCCLMVYLSGAICSRGCKIYAIRDVNGGYKAFLIVLPVVGEYWCYKRLGWSYSIGMVFSGNILVIENGSCLMYSYDSVKREFVLTGKLPQNIARQIIRDVKRGRYRLVTPRYASGYCF